MGNTPNTFPQDFVGRWAQADGGGNMMLIVSSVGGISYSATSGMGGNINLSGVKLKYNEETKIASFKGPACFTCFDMTCEYPVRDQTRGMVRTMKCNNNLMVNQNDVAQEQRQEMVQEVQQMAMANQQAAINAQQQAIMAQQMELQRLQLQAAQQNQMKQGYQVQGQQPYAPMIVVVAPVKQQ